MSEKPATPMRIATPIEITTQTEATRLESLIFFLSSMAMNLKRM